MLREDMRKSAAFIRRDFLIHVSYRFDFLLEWLNVIGKLATFYFIARLFESQVSSYLVDYHTDYFSFVFVGIAFSSYTSAALQYFSISIRNEQLMGTLEAMLATPSKASAIVISLCLWNFIFTTISISVYFLLGPLLFGVDLGNANIFSSLIVLLLTLVSFGSIGIMAASFIILFKKGNPIIWLIGTFSQFFGGTFFPISILPEKLLFISYLLPVTYSLKALRHSILQGYSFGMLLNEIGILFIFALILPPLSIIIFKYAIKQSKIKGTLAHY